MTKPFTQGRFEDLPEHPRARHGYAETRGVELELESRSLGSMRVHVRTCGSGPPLLLVHGLMTSSYSWRYVYQPLGEHYTVYAPDLPSNGRSDRPVAPRYSPDSLAVWLGEVQEALGIRGCDVIGNSMGGYLSMVWALRDPGAIRRLVNLHSPGVPELRLRGLKSALTVPGSKALLRWLIRRDPERWAHRHVHYFDESLKSREEAREYGAPLADRDGATGLIKYLHETMDITDMKRFARQLRERRERSEPFPVPLLLVYAERDPMVPPRFGDVFASWIPEAQLVRLSRASHFAHVDAVEAFLPPVRRFFGIDAEGD